MIMQLHKSQRRHILIDIDTQRDFLSPSGIACISNYQTVLANIRRIIAWVRMQNIRVISTAEVYPGRSSSSYCIDGTEGQQKISYTLLGNRVSFAADGWNTLPADLLRRYQQVILHKRCIDPFEEPQIDKLLSEVRADEFILIGCSAEEAVVATALGLLQRGRDVTVVSDATGFHNQRQAKLAFGKMAVKGATLVNTSDIAGLSHLTSQTTRCYEGFEANRPGIIKPRLSPQMVFSR
jgi:nicotinamidase-related amidase